MTLPAVADFTVDVRPGGSTVAVDLSAAGDRRHEALAEAYRILQDSFQRAVGREELWEVAAVAEGRRSTTSYRMRGSIRIDRTLWWQADALDGPYAPTSNDLVETNRWLSAHAAVAAARALEALMAPAGDVPQAAGSGAQ